MTKAKLLGIILSVIGYAITIGEAYVGNLAPDTAAIVAALISVGYLASRVLAKIVAGADPKSIFKTTEFWGTALVALSTLALAIVGKVGGGRAAGIALILGVILKLGKSLIDTQVPPPIADGKSPRG